MACGRCVPTWPRVVRVWLLLRFTQKRDIQPQETPLVLRTRFVMLLAYDADSEPAQDNFAIP